MKLRKCRPSDLGELIRIGRETYYDTFHSMNSSENMEEYLGRAFSTEKISEELNNPDSAFYFLGDNDPPAGYMKVNLGPAQSDLNEAETLELERIYVRREHKGKGYGKLMIDKAVEIAKSEGCKAIWLGVWEKNDHAVAFYRKMGFEIADRHTFRMGDDLQNDYIMRKSI